MTPTPLDASLALIDQLRKLADHVEANGPDVVDWDSGVLNISYEYDDLIVGDRRLSQLSGIRLSGDLCFRACTKLHPLSGLKLTKAEDGLKVRWNGEPPRPPKRGEYCLHPEDDMKRDYVRQASRNLKRNYFIYDEVS